MGRDWTETVLRVNHGFMAERVPDVLLAAEPEWYAPGVLLMNLLGLLAIVVALAAQPGPKRPLLRV